MKIKPPINIKELSKYPPVIYKAQIYYDNGQVVDVPGVYTHPDAFAAGQAMAKQLREEGSSMGGWVYVTEAETPPPEKRGCKAPQNPATAS